MRFMISLGGLLVAVAAFATYHSASDAAAVNFRQYYSNGNTIGRWHYHPTQRVYSTYYRYRPQPTVQTYQHHVAYYYPARPRHVYYYNPQSQHYWGRCPLNPTPQNPYQILDYGHRKANLTDVDESHFQSLPARLNPPQGPQQVVQGPMPPIPGSTDGEQMQPPPPPPAMPPAE